MMLTMKIINIMIPFWDLKMTKKAVVGATNAINLEWKNVQVLLQINLNISEQL